MVKLGRNGENYRDFMLSLSKHIYSLLHLDMVGPHICTDLIFNRKLF